MKSYTLNAIFFLFLACSCADSATVRPKGFFSRNSTTIATETPKLDSPKVVEARNTITTATALPDTIATTTTSSTSTTIAPLASTTRRRIPNIFNVVRNTTTPRTRLARNVVDTEDEIKSDEDDKIHEENHSDAPADRKTLDPKSLQDSEARANPTVVPLDPALKASGAAVVPAVSRVIPVAHDETTVRKPTLTLPKADISALPLATKDAKTDEEPHLLPTPKSEENPSSHSITKRSLTTLIPLMSSMGAPAALALLAQAFFAPFIALILGLLGGIGSSWWMGQLPGLDRFNPFTSPSPDSPTFDNEISSRSSRGFDFDARNVMSAIESGYKMWQNIQKKQL